MDGNVRNMLDLGYTLCVGIYMLLMWREITGSQNRDVKNITL